MSLKLLKSKPSTTGFEVLHECSEKADILCTSDTEDEPEEGEEERESDEDNTPLTPDTPFGEGERKSVTNSDVTLVTRRRGKESGREGTMTAGARHEADSRFGPLLRNLDSFYLKGAFMRAKECFDRPLCSRPGAWIDIIEREAEANNQSFKLTAGRRRCLNMGSYNYLGFADNSPVCTEQVMQALNRYGVAQCSPSTELGTTDLHRQLEAEISDLLGKDDCVVFGQGFATNSTALPAMTGPGSLVVSDSLNHASIVTGARLSGAEIRVFRHNDPDHLDGILRDAVVNGNRATGEPYTKVLVLVEGVYSMEGEICDLPSIVAVKNKYKALLFVDEAHSIGALGKSGGGVVDYYGMDSSSADILMGTFTKAFGSVGGYVCADRDTCAYVREHSLATRHSTALPTPCVQQILSVLSIIRHTEQGRDRITALHDNAVYFRTRLQEMGFKVYGHKDSPVVPVLVYHPAKMKAVSNMLMDRNIAVVVVGFPAVPIVSSRIRFCISAAHTREDLDYLLGHFSEIGDCLRLKYNKHQGLIA
ncbi:hypothetical protein KIPB_006543 [Kipferlia bialata]|uniref:serine C-palmitoyltransferase n=1 Tax=Kipferlia bialata TaxID=797122 RepID=A0A9K3CYY4_9EUKA|nr:hypothetical protein KIPB_006543 [Kipferlia bialata]|eukprot:g6543.t1